MIIKEYRVLLPMTVEEYQVGQLWSVAEASKNETGGGEGIEVLENKPFENEEFGKGQYTYKIYHLASRVPKFIRLLAPKGALEFHEEAWNAYPYCRTVITNPYMDKNMKLSIETWHKPDFGDAENVHGLSAEDWKNTTVVPIDIADNSVISSGDYKEECDPTKVKFKNIQRPALGPNWIQDIRSQLDAIEKTKQNGDCATAPQAPPHMCAYKLVKMNFKWFGIQNRVERFTHTQEKRLFTNFHRQVFCWMDNWLELNMDDIRRIEDATKEELEDMRRKGSIKGTKVDDDKSE